MKNTYMLQMLATSHRQGGKIFHLARAAQLAMETPSDLSNDDLLAAILESIEDTALQLLEDIMELAEAAGVDRPTDARANARAAVITAKYLEARP